jgi:hypothetical protein
MRDLFARLVDLVRSRRRKMVTAVQTATGATGASDGKECDGDDV